METWKKCLALLLALVLVLSLGACGAAGQPEAPAPEETTEQPEPAEESEEPQQPAVPEEEEQPFVFTIAELLPSGSYNTDQALNTVWVSSRDPEDPDRFFVLLLNNTNVVRFGHGWYQTGLWNLGSNQELQMAFHGGYTDTDASSWETMDAQVTYTYDRDGDTLTLTSSSVKDPEQVQNGNITYYRAQDCNAYAQCCRALEQLMANNSQYWVGSGEALLGVQEMLFYWAGLEDQVLQLLYQALPAEDQALLTEAEDQWRAGLEAYAEETTEEMLAEIPEAAEEDREMMKTSVLADVHTERVYFLLEKLQEAQKGAPADQAAAGDAEQAIAVYAELLQEIRDGIERGEITPSTQDGYLLLDLTGDQVPELFLRDSNLGCVYQCDGGELVKLGEIPGPGFSVAPLAQPYGFLMVLQKQWVESIYFFTLDEEGLKNFPILEEVPVSDFPQDDTARDEVQGYHALELLPYYSFDDPTGLQNPGTVSNANGLLFDILVHSLGLD